MELALQAVQALQLAVGQGGRRDAADGRAVVGGRRAAGLEGQQVVGAQGLLGLGQEALLLKCHRAIAYARVYADDNPELLDKLEAVSLPRCVRNNKGGTQTLQASDAKSQGKRAARRQGQRPLFLEPSANEPVLVENQAA